MPCAPLKYDFVMVRNRSWPAVSQIYTRNETVRPARTENRISLPALISMEKSIFLGTYSSVQEVGALRRDAMNMAKMIGRNDSPTIPGISEAIIEAQGHTRKLPSYYQLNVIYTAFTCSLTVLSPSFTVLILKSMPIVVMNVDENVPSAYRSSKHVLPTPDNTKQKRKHLRIRHRAGLLAGIKFNTTFRTAADTMRGVTLRKYRDYHIYIINTGRAGFQIQQRPVRNRASIDVFVHTPEKASKQGMLGRLGDVPLFPTVSSLICMSYRSCFPAAAMFEPAKRRAR